MVLARKGRTAHSKQPAGEVSDMAHGWPSVGEGAGAGGAGAEPGLPRAVFVPHANSLPFEERCVPLEQPVKIGRNVYRAMPTPTNTIFECRVLSRHHATLWYEKGHFYIMDNQSSNGTFINNNRCSIGKENEPHEVFSGDVLQFGIAVVENQSNQEKNTFLPVVALLKLYHPDGKEAKLTFNPAMTTPLHLKELYQLNNFLQEAMHREAGLESRLRTLRECVERARAEALSGWRLLVGEQRLLARVHALEATARPADQLRLAEDKRNYQEVAQESLREAHEQRLALEEALEKKSREAHALHQSNCDLRLTTNQALAELQKLAARCERKICAAKIAIASAEEREAATRARLPIALSQVNGLARMLLVSPDPGPAEVQSLSDAVRALPDYVKLLLPEHVLAQVGIKAVTIDAKNVKECDLILKTSENSEVENPDKRSLDESGWQEDNSMNEEPGTQLIAEEKNGILNHDSSELNATVHETSLRCGELADNNANSTFRPPENHNDAQKSQPEVSVWAGVVRGLREEVGGLRARLAELASDNEQLRAVRDQLLAVKLEVQEELNERAMLEQVTADSDLEADTEKHDPESHKELAARLQRALDAERLLAEQLAQRPSNDNYSELTLTCQKLQEELRERDHLLQELRQTPCASATASTVTLVPAEKCDRAVNTADNENIDLDEMSALNELDEALGEFGGDESVEDEHDDLDTIVSAGGDLCAETRELADRTKATEEIINVKTDFTEDIREQSPEEVVEEKTEEAEVETARKSIEFEAKKETEAPNDNGTDHIEVVNVSNTDIENKTEMKEDRDADKELLATVLLQEGGAGESAALLALQEEMVRVKERWAEARAELARLQTAQAEPRALLPYVAALLAGLVYTLLYRYLS